MRKTASILKQSEGLSHVSDAYMYIPTYRAFFVARSLLCYWRLLHSLLDCDQ